MTEEIKLFKIKDLNSSKYLLKKPIRVTVKKYSNIEYIAEFEGCGIVYTGNSISDAVRELEAEIIEVYELYKNNPRFRGMA